MKKHVSVGVVMCFFAVNVIANPFVHYVRATVNHPVMKVVIPVVSGCVGYQAGYEKRRLDASKNPENLVSATVVLHQYKAVLKRLEEIEHKVS